MDIIHSVKSGTFPGGVEQEGQIDSGMATNLDNPLRLNVANLDGADMNLT